MSLPQPASPLLLSVVDSCTILTEEDLFLAVSLIVNCLLESFLFLLFVYFW